jgi:tetratricopeptide (TPR) repeat protein
MGRLAIALLLASRLFAAPPGPGSPESSKAAGGSVVGAGAVRAPSEFDRARELYQRTEYQSSLNLLLPLANKDAEEFQLIGQDRFMLGDYKKAAEAFDNTLSLLQGSHRPIHVGIYVWLGRAYGRRAETSGPLSAPGYASHSRKYFEAAVQMDIRNKEASGDLFDYYMGAPGFLGGGLSKAQDLAQRVSAADPAEGQHLQALLSEKSKDYAAVEQHLRSAIRIEPQQASRVMELARFLARRGRAQESDSLFDQAQRTAPQDHSILFYRAETDIETNRNLGNAHALLESYLRAPLTPDDPPRRRAEELLAKTH